MTVIGGYLGAGKTTLVNNLLRSAEGRRLCVLVNDFGAEPIDRDLIVAADGDTLELSGGCVCCSYGSDLMDALAGLLGRLPQVEHVVIETSGVALPDQVASAVGLLPAFRIDGTVVLVDAETVRARADDVYIGDTIRRQLAAADLLVVNRCDLAGRDDLSATLHWLAMEAPTAQRLATSRGVVAADVILGLRDEASAASSLPADRRDDDAAVRYEAFEIALAAQVDAAALAARLTRPELGLLRAKAIVRDVGMGLAVVHTVGRRAEIDAAPSSARPSRLVAIGVRGQLDRNAIVEAVRSTERVRD
ncbi:MAG: CobW family GTP-binding protein [Pseudomonadota bacterium]